MSGYDPKLDEIIEEKEIDITDPFSKSQFKQKFILRLARYNGGPMKLDIKRLSYGRDRRGQFANLGRLAKHEIEDLLPEIEALLEKM